MTASVVNRVLKPYGKGARPVTMPLGAYHFFAGNLVSQLAASPGSLCPAGTALSGAAIGVMTHEQDNSGGSAGDLRGQMLTDGIFIFQNSSGDPCAETTAFGALVYCENDYIVSKTNGGAQFAAGYFVGMEPDGNVRVYISPRALQPADLTTLATSAGAGDIGILDAGGFTAATTVEGALAEIYQQVETTHKQVNIPLMSAIDIATGAPLAAFADAEGATPGTEFTNSKGVSVRWNDHATPGAIAVTVPMPQDLDDTAVVTFCALVSKTGATSGDATKLTVGAFEQAVGALNDADTDFGGDTSAVVGNATAKTVSKVTLTLAAADVHAAPEAMTFTIKPKAGTLGTDDLCLHAAWLEYKGKLLTT